MTKIIGRIFIGLPLLVFGVQHLLHGEFVTRVAPPLPPWLPWHPLWADALGVILIAGGLALLTGRSARNAARLLGVGLLASTLLLQLPRAVGDPFNGGLWTNAGKTLALAAGSLVLAGLLARGRTDAASTTASRLESIDRLAPLGRYGYSAFLVLCGVQHFIYPQFVATLVPAWIGGALFWTYFGGVALIVGGTGILSAAAPRLAARLTGAMIFAWLILLHLPRALANLHDANETTAVFEAMAMSGIGFLIADFLPQKKRAPERAFEAGESGAAVQRQ